MFDQLRPPTDNLYKFLALAGLAAAIVAGYIQTTTYIRLLAYGSLQKDADMTAASYSTLSQAAISKIGAELQAKKIDAKAAQEHKDYVIKLTDSYVSKFTKEHDEAGDAYHKLYAETKDQSWILGIVGLMGLAIAVAGFVLWYFKLQKPLDEIMKYDLLERREKAKVKPV